jgi:hypothetical protein
VRLFYKIKDTAYNKMGEFYLTKLVFCDKIHCDVLLIFRTKECYMKEAYINLEDAINYLVEQFYLTDRKFSCTRTKIGKILSIIAFRYALREQKLFKETIHEYNGCGTIIYEVMDRFDDGDIYTRIQYNDDCHIIKNEEFNKNAEIPNEYRNYNTLSEENKKIIRTAFCRFGAYSQSELGRYITSILSIKDVVNNNGEVNLDQISKLTDKDFSEKNTVIKFLFEE